MSSAMDMARPAAAAEAQPARRLLLFGVSRLDNMLAQGHVWYVRHYESYFDAVEVAYLYGSHAPVARGRTRLSGIGANGRFWRSFLAAPWRLWRFAARVRPTHYLTGDIVFSWWTGLLLRWLMGARVVLMPVCTPEEIYRNSGKSFSGLPIVIERALRWLSFRAAATALVARNSPATLAWLRSQRVSQSKLVVADATPEELPDLELLTGLEGVARRRVPRIGSTVTLLYVGRLEREKLCADLIPMMSELVGRGIDARLEIAGDGTLLAAMQRETKERGLDLRVVFHKFVPAERLLPLYEKADIFTSTLTGTALREAALAKLAIVAYAIDFAALLFQDGITAALVSPATPTAMAERVAALAQDIELRRSIADNARQFAAERWTTAAVRRGLAQAFPPHAAAADKQEYTP